MILTYLLFITASAHYIDQAGLEDLPGDLKGLIFYFALFNKRSNFQVKVGTFFITKGISDFWMEALEDSYHSPVLMPMLKRFPLFDPALHKDHNH